MSHFGRVSVLKSKMFYITIVMVILINVAIGIFIFNASVDGHSSLGVILGCAIPLMSIAFHIDSYRKLFQVQTNLIRLKAFISPSIKISIVMVALFLGFYMWQAIEERMVFLDAEIVAFFATFSAAFLIPNLMMELCFYGIMRHTSNKAKLK